MANQRSYLKIVEHDLKLLDLLTGVRPNHLKSEDFSDWQVTSLFYIVCIYLKAVCLLWGENIQDHFTLKQQINSRPELISIAAAYRHLEEASRDARYEGRVFDKSYLITRLQPKFITVRDCAVGLLESAGISAVYKADPTVYLSR